MRNLRTCLVLNAQKRYLNANLSVIKGKIYFWNWPQRANSVRAFILLLFFSRISSTKYTNDNSEQKIADGNQDAEIIEEVRIASWIVDKPDLQVTFTHRAEKNLAQLDTEKLSHLTSVEAVRRAIADILRADPRSNYRRQKCADRLYYFDVDNVHVTCWFDISEDGHSEIAEVLKVTLKQSD